MGGAHPSEAVLRNNEYRGIRLEIGDQDLRPFEEERAAQPATEGVFEIGSMYPLTGVGVKLSIKYSSISDSQPFVLYALADCTESKPYDLIRNLLI